MGEVSTIKWFGRYLQLVGCIAWLSVVALATSACSQDSQQSVDSSSAHVITHATALPSNPELAQIYQQTCMGCHANGLGKAPVTGDLQAWQARLQVAANKQQQSSQGDSAMDVLLSHTINGYGGMPPLGSCADCDLQELTALIHFMVDPEKSGMAEPTTAVATTVASTVNHSDDLGRDRLTQQQLQQYRNYCSGCHATGALDAPVTGNVAAWQGRLNQGNTVLLNNTRAGIGYMPAMGGCNDCTDADLLALIQYMAGAGHADAANRSTQQPTPSEAP